VTLRVLVVDDEPLARTGIARLVSATPGFEVAGTVGDGASAVEAVETLRPDLVLLDVQMPGCDGFEVIRRVGPERMPAVVFVTAWDEFALKAFEVHAIDYVLKPFEDERLRAALAHARVCDGDTLRRLVDRQRLEVRTGARVRLVPVGEIDWIEGASYYSMLHAGKEVHLIRETLQSLEERLGPAHFVRVHRSALVQLDRVRELRNGKVLVLRDGSQVTVSRARRASVRAALRKA
jgi:two-component system, LytTR family, response regulator